MKPKNVIVGILLLGIVVLLMSTSVQAKELTEVNATDILEKIVNGEDVYLENVCIIGVFNLTKIELKTVPIARSKWEIKYGGLENELKIVESEIAIINSFFENDVDFSYIQFRKNVDFGRTTFLGQIDFEGADFSGDAYFGEAYFSGDAYFEFADFRGDAFFWSADFRGDAFFGDADFIGDATFYSTEFNKVSFTGAPFTTVSLNESDFNRMKVEWSSLKDALVFDGQIYIKLIKNWDQYRFGALKS